MLADKIIFLDIESTGLNISQDRIVEIAIIKFDGEQTIEKCSRINPGISIPESATAIHGISDADVKDKPTFKQLARGILDFISGCAIAGYNSNAFDIPLLYTEFNRAGIAWDYSATSFIDVRNIFKRKEARDLSAAVKFYCGVEHEGGHSALHDAKATAKVLIAQLQRYEDLPENIMDLAKYSNYDKETYDLGGCFTKDERGSWLFNFGQYKYKFAHAYPSYLEWMLNSDFLPDAKQICRDILNSAR